MVNHPNRKSRRTNAAVSVTLHLEPGKKIRKVVRKVPRKPKPAHDHDADYAALLSAVSHAFSAAGANKTPLFCTDVELLNDRYLAHVGSERSVHDCHACRRFIDTYGGLATIDDAGYLTSAFWDTDRVPVFYRSAVGAMADAVARAHVTGPFRSKDVYWGTPVTGDWTHLAVRNENIYRHALLSPGQAMAAKREDFKTVERALAEFSPSLLKTAINVLESGHLQSSEKFITPLNWLVGLREARDAVKDHRVKANFLWKAIATAPDGYCHPRAAVTGTLLEDLAAGMSFDDVKKRFDAKVHPLQYQRPQAAPTAGNIADAEKIVEELGIGPSLERRFARLDECQVEWRPLPPKAPASTGGGVFAHLRPKEDAAPAGVIMPPVTMTWEKFVRTVLPAAETIRVKMVARPMPFIGLTAAVHAYAPGIFKWDHPVAWYLYSSGSLPQSWNLPMGFVKVTGIVPLPPMWGDQPKPHLGEGVILVLDGCVDARIAKGEQGNMLFPECLRSELHAVRSTIEAYSRKALLGGADQASACGLDIRKGRNGVGYTLRVLTEGRETDYTIDRWD